MDGVDVNTAITTLTIAAGLALGIERTLELLKHFMDSGNGALGKDEHAELIGRAKQALAEARAAIAGAGVPEAEDNMLHATLPVDVAPLNPVASDYEASEQYPPPSIPVVPPTPLSTLTTGNQLFFLLAASGLGIILAQLFQVHLLSMLMVSADETKNLSLSFIFLDTLFTGLVIGGGSQPIHVLIRFLSERKVDLATDEAAVVKENAKFKALGTVVASASLVEEKKEPRALQWQNIVYRGGVNPETLENTHRRPANPNLIVYHHTAMSSAKSFQEVVDEFLLTKQWLTGYNCVIMPDGAIKPFCRWDRYGNHARGHNARSLGISFHGNFHTAPGDNFSNADGRYGNQQPTEAQLHAGARVVALWVFLYPDIALDFTQSILAHKEAMPGHTVCPGSNFKYEEFKRLVRQYHDAWAGSHEVQQEIEAFRKLDYIYV